MTDNHILLYRLAELMLEHEQHVLPVDLLFDDEQIGDFVKSIQIDSPYQQMLVEGVLTETVKEEKLFVSFTVEGYFHYVLGEVIYQKSKDKDAGFLKKIVEVNKLIGAKEGVEQCLIIEIINDDFSRLLWLIDHGENALNIYSIPLANSFLQYKSNPKTKEEKELAISEQVDKIMRALLASPTDNDIEVLELAINHLDKMAKNLITGKIKRSINYFVKPDTPKKVLLNLRVIEFIENDRRTVELDKLIKSTTVFDDSKDILSIYEVLGIQFYRLSNYEKSLFYLTKAKKLIKKYKKNHYKKLSNVINYIGLANYGMNNYDIALVNYNEALSVIEKINKFKDLQESYTYVNISSVLIKLKQYDNALEYLNKALSIKLKYFGNVSNSTSITYNSIGLVWIYKEEFFEGIKYLEKAILITKSLSGENDINVGRIHQNIALAYESNNNTQEAIIHYKKSLDILNLFNHIDLLSAYNGLAGLYNKIGRYDDSIKYYKISLKKSKLFHSDIIIILETYCLIGGVWKSKGNYLNSIKVYKKALSIFYKCKNKQQEYFSRRPLQELIFNELAFLFTALKDYDFGIEYYEKLLDLRINVYGDNALRTASAYSFLASTWSKKGVGAEAVKYYEKTLKIKIFNYGQNNLELCKTYNNLGSLWTKNGNYEKAVNCYKNTLEIRIAHFGEMHSEIGDSYKYIAKIYEIKKEVKKSLKYYEKAFHVYKSVLGKDDKNTMLIFEKISELYDL